MVSAAKSKKRFNPLKVDPTRTGTIQRQFMSEFHKRMKWLVLEVWKLVSRDDEFALAPTKRMTWNSKRFQFLTDEKKLGEFQKWLSGKMEEGILGNPDAPSEQWWNSYIGDAYKKGIGRVFDDFRASPMSASDEASVSDFYKGTKTEFLNSAFNNPVNIESVKLLASRTYTDIKGMTDALSMDLRRALTDGIAQGSHPSVIARKMRDTIEGMERKRAYTIARTETARAHSDGQLDALDKLGIEEIGVAVEWSVTPDGKVCPLCSNLEGVVLKVKEARGMLPRHPNCRCAYIPANVGEVEPKQKRTKAEVTEAIDKSIQAENPNKPLQELKDASKWVGVDKSITKGRPTSILEKRVKKEKKPIDKLDPVKPPEKKIEPVEPVVIEKPKVEERQTPVPPVPVEPPKPKSTFASRRFDKVEDRLKNPELEEFRKKFVDYVADPKPLVDLFEKQVWEERAKMLKVVQEAEEIYEKRNALREKKKKTPEDLEELERLDLESTLIFEEVRNLKKEYHIRKRGEKAPRAIHLKEVMKDVKELLKDEPKVSVTITQATDNQKLHPIGVGRTWDKTIVPAAGSIDDIVIKQNLDLSRQFFETWMSRNLGEQADVSVISRVLPETISRAFYWDKAIYTNPETPLTVYIHEIAHDIEARTPGVYKLCEEFRSYRIEKSGTKDVSMKKTYPDHNYSKEEFGNEDDWGKLFDRGDSSRHYVGKTYPSEMRSTEVFSMGVELLAKDPLKFAKVDPEYFNFITGILRGAL